MMSENNKTFIALALLVSFGFVILLIFSQGERSRDSLEVKTARDFSPVEIEAKSAYVYDVRSERVLFSKDANLSLPLASLSKLMSALVAEDVYYDYGTVTISEEALETYGDSGLTAGERWTLKDLLDFSLITSSNDGIKAIALTLGGTDFIKSMNRKALDLGLSESHFQNETGLDEDDLVAGSYGSARDISVLMRHILEKYPEALEATKFQTVLVSTLDGKSYEVKNTNSLTSEIPRLLASKTGFTDMAGGNLAFVFDPELGRPIIVVVLGSSIDGRFSDARELVAATMSYISEN